MGGAEVVISEEGGEETCVCVGVRLVGVQEAFEFVEVNVFGAAEVVPHVHRVVILIVKRHCVK
jgi:hypothetical protein